MALEALEGMQNAIYNIYGEHVIDLKYAVEKADVAEQTITAVKEALAQEQEPVAWEQFYPDIGKLQLTHPPQGIYYTPPQRKPLTDGEINLLAKAYSTMEGELNAPAFARAILRKAQIKVGCAECGVNGNHALYCVTCAENYLKDKNTRGQE